MVYMKKDVIRLNEQKLKTELNSLKVDVKIFDIITSTSTYARNNIDSFINNTLVASEHQSEGRGRKGNSFISNERGIYFTLCLKDLNIDQIDLITIIAGISLVRTLKEKNINCTIKWVNDIFFKNKKCAGILAEAVCDSYKNRWILLGVGININLKKLDSRIKDVATSIFIDNYDPNEIISRYIIILDELLKINTNMIIEEYKKYLNMLNKWIDFTYKDKKCKGLTIDITDKGHLLVKCKDDVLELSSGEISITSSQIVETFVNKK